MSKTISLDEITAFYLQPSPMNDPGAYLPRFAELPDDVPGIVRAVQGLMIHIFWAERYGLELSEERQSEVQIRPLRGKLARLLERDDRPLNEARPIEKRLVGNCRDFSLMTGAMLRSKGIPARARCGFGTYFMPNHYEDHWMVEWWDAAENRWVRTDAQLDELQREKLGIRFDTLDMPEGAFVTGGAAWLLCRRAAANPDDFGIFEYHGWDFIKGNLFRDLLALNNFEVLPWDFWSALEPAYADCSPEQLAELDRVAENTLGGNETFAAVRNLYQRYQAPAEWAS